MYIFLLVELFYEMDNLLKHVKFLMFYIYIKIFSLFESSNIKID